MVTAAWQGVLELLVLLAASWDEGVQLIDISTPSAPVPVGVASDGSNGFTELYNSFGVKTFTVGASVYAIVCGKNDHGCQIMDLSNLSPAGNPVAVSSIEDGVNGFNNLQDPCNVDVFVLGSSTYAVVASFSDDAVQIVDMTDPYAPLAVGAAKDGTNSFVRLDGALDVSVYEDNGSVYGIVAAEYDGLQFMHLGDLYSCIAASGDTAGYSIPVPTATTVTGLGDVTCAAGFTGGAMPTCAAQGANFSYSGCVRDLVPLATSLVYDGSNGFDYLAYAMDVDTFVISTQTYAIATTGSLRWFPRGNQLRQPR